MSIDKETVAKVAKLARIYLTDEEKSRMSGQLTKIFDWMEELKQVNTDGISEMSSVGGYILRARKDEITDGGIRDDVLANAPEKAFGCYVVPKVVE